MSAHESAVEAREIVGLLQTTKFAVLVNVLQSEPDCFTRGGRINCASVSRHLNMAPTQVSEMMRELRASGPGY